MATGRLGWGGDLTPLVGHRTCLPLDETSRPVDTTPTRRGCLCLLAPVGCDLGHVEGGAERGSASVRARSALGQGTSDNRGQQWSPNVSQIHSSLPGCREPSGLLPARRWSPKTTLTVGSGWNQRCNRIPGSSSAAVPPACHSPRSWPVPSGQPRTTTKQPRPAPFPILAGGNSARSGFGSRWSEVKACIGLVVPIRPIRSLVAEDRSAAGVRDRTPMLTRLLTDLPRHPGMHRDRAGRRFGRRPAQRPQLVKPGEAPAATARRQLGPDALTPR
jgi:hypothetical protein